jgi:multidrug resistance efflux pump
VPIKGMREFHQEKGPIGAHFLNTSSAHLREVGQEQRPRRQLRVARAGRAPAKVEEHLESIEASLRELHTARAADHAILEQLRAAQATDHAILEQLQEHLMRSLDLKDYGIHSPSKGRRSPSAKSTPARGSMDCNSRR